MSSEFIKNPDGPLSRNPNWDGKKEPSSLDRGVWDDVSDWGSSAKDKIGSWWSKHKPGGGGGESAGDAQRRQWLNETASAANSFADQGQAGYGAMTAEAQAAREAMRRRAMGQDSLSREQLRQGLQQNMSAQRSMAASASPLNASMAALQAAQTMGRQGAGMSGQAATAGIQERAQAEQALAQMIMQQRQQDSNVALGSRSNAITGYGDPKAEKTWWEKYGPAATGALTLAASDRRLKTDIEDGDAKARKATDGLKAYSYKYRDQKYGGGKQFGPMAQDLEKAGLGHAVIDTPSGKMVHGAKLALSNTAMVAALGKRLAALEKGRK